MNDVELQEHMYHLEYEEYNSNCPLCEELEARAENDRDISDEDEYESEET